MTIVLLESENFALERYLPAMTPWYSADHSMYLRGLSQMFEAIYDLVRGNGSDGDDDYVPPWGILFDPDLCPTEFLPFLGQFLGVGNLTGVADVTARALIYARPTYHRGTPASIISAAQATLTGTQTVTLTEFYEGNPYFLQVITYTAQTPNPDQTLAAILAVKPGGIILTYSVLSGQDWQQVRDEVAGRTWGQLLTTYPSWAAVRDHLP